MDLSRYHRREMVVLVTLYTGSWPRFSGWMFGIEFDHTVVAYAQRHYSMSVHVGPWKWWIGVELDAKKKEKPVRAR